MASEAYLVKSSGELRHLESKIFEKERQLDAYVEKYPELLARALSTPEKPLRFVLVGTQEEIDDPTGDRAARWSADAFFLDQHGVLTIVEDKLSSNPEIRRKIVGQMLEYAASAVETLDVADIQRRLAKTHEDFDQIVEDLVGQQEDDDEENRVERLWEAVQNNLKTGEVRMVFVADRIPRELTRVIEFMNDHMDPMHIAGVEISRLRDSDGGHETEILVTTVVGVTERARKRKDGKTIGNTPISRQEFLADLKAMRDASATGRATRSLLDALLRNEADFEFEIYRTPKAGSLCIVSVSNNGPNLVAIVANTQQNKCFITFNHVRWKWPRELLTSLTQLVGKAPSGRGREITDWIAESDSNVTALAGWITAAATADRVTS